MRKWIAYVCLAGSCLLAAPASGPAAAASTAGIRLKAVRAAVEIHLNQTGFYPFAPKIAVITGAAAGPFYVITADRQDTVFRGKLALQRTSRYSSERTRIADFSSLKQTGTFVLCLPGDSCSAVFAIRDQVHDPLAKASLKGFYHQRASVALLPEFAGQWARAAGHADNNVLVHASAAQPGRPVGTVLSSPGGWYDAGDYNKYVVNSGITMGTLLSLYEDFPDYFKKQNTGIPESGNKLPDLLDEILWNLRWMLTMQDPGDGGVYHKLTAAEFEGMIMPERAVAQRYVVMKSTAATLDFAAVTAQAGRVFRDFEQELPGLSDSCIQAAESAWKWASKNPRRYYDQEAMNQRYDPDVKTGAYGDRNLEDEFSWAAAELYISTGRTSYYKAIRPLPEAKLPLPSWSQVHLLGYYSLLRFERKLPAEAKQHVQRFREKLVQCAADWTTRASIHPYQTVMGSSENDFVWGSNSVAANQGILLLQAYRVAPRQEFLWAALANLDYLLGRNATGYSFLTGFGDKTPLHPHHRPSVADRVADPVPGLLVGGPNPGRQDGCTYPSAIASHAYTDSDCSYASNEIAINWNAPFVYLVSALEAILPIEGKGSF